MRPENLSPQNLKPLGDNELNKLSRDLANQAARIGSRISTLEERKGLGKGGSIQSGESP